MERGFWKKCSAKKHPELLPTDTNLASEARLQQAGWKDWDKETMHVGIPGRSLNFGNDTTPQHPSWSEPESLRTGPHRGSVIP